MAEAFVNEINPSITLSTSINSTVTTLTPSSVTALPASGTFRIRIDNEYMKASVSGSDLTVTRGDGGTTAASHASTAPIYVIVTAEALNAIMAFLSAGTEIANRKAINCVSGLLVADDATNKRVNVTGPNVGVAASRSGTAAPGLIYVPTDGVVSNIYDGTNWLGIDAPVLTLPPVLSNWTTLNTTGSSIVDVPGGGITIIPKITSSGNLVGMYRSIPAHGTAWTRTAFFNFIGTGRCGIFVYDSATSKCQGYCWLTGAPGIDEIFYTNPTTATTNVQQSVIQNHGSCFRLRLKDDGTNRLVQYSSDGINWVTWRTESNTNNVTPNFCGFFADPQDSAIPSIGTLIHWVESSP